LRSSLLIKFKRSLDTERLLILMYFFFIALF